MGMADTNILAFKIKADTNDAEASVKNFVNTIVSQSHAAGQAGVSNLGIIGTALTSLTGPAAAAVAGLTAVAGACVGAAAAVVSLAKESAAYASEIGGAAAKTGLSTESISALKYATELAGKELDDFTKVFPKFQKLLAEAAQGSDTAAEKLKRMHIDKAVWADQDKALEQLFKRVNELQNPIERTKALQDAFGRSGAEIGNVFKRVGGNFQDFKKQVDDLGLSMSKEETGSAKDYNTAMRTLDAQMSHLKYTIGKDLIPVVADLAREFSSWLSKNKGEVESWSKAIASYVKDVIQDFKDLKAWIDAHPSVGEFFRASGELYRSGGDIAGYYNHEYQSKPPTAEAPKPSKPAWQSAHGATPDVDYNTDFAAEEEAEDKRKKAAEKRAKEREELAKHEARNQIDLLQIQYDDAIKAYEDYAAKLQEKFKADGNESGLRSGIEGAGNDLSKEFDAIVPALEALENKALKMSGAIDSDFTKLAITQKKRVESFNDTIKTVSGAADKILADQYQKNAEDTKKNDEEIAKNKLDIAQATSDKQLAFLENQLAKQIIDEQQYQKAVYLEQHSILQTRIDAETDITKKKILTLDLEKLELKNEGDLAKLKTAQQERDRQYWQDYKDFVDSQVKANQRPGTLKQRVDPFADLKKSWQEFKDEVKNSADLTKSFESIGQIGVHMLFAMRDAVGQAVESWVLYGESIATALRKALAAELAHVAGIAAIKALEATALGFLDLAYGNFSGAAHAFLSAGLWAALAGGAALAGRAINPKAATAAAATQTSSATTHTASSQGGKPYSSLPDQVIEGGNTAGSRSMGHLKVTIGLDNNGVLKLLKTNYDGNGIMRRMILDGATA